MRVTALGAEVVKGRPLWVAWLAARLCLEAPTWMNHHQSPEQASTDNEVSKHARKICCLENESEAFFALML